MVWTNCEGSMKKSATIRHVPGSGKRVPASPPRLDWPIALVAVLALAVSAYLASLKLVGSTPLFCEAQSGCDVVQSSRYAVFLGVPTALWGAALYAVIAGLALAGLTVSRWLAAFVLAGVAVSFSGYLTYLELGVIRAVCPYCVVVAMLAVLLFALLVIRRPVSSARRSPTRPGRMVGVAVATAFVTVFIAVGVFSATSPTSGSPYREALARHLTSSGALFYGAFW
jgi:uncharacterized membrane protein